VVNRSNLLPDDWADLAPRRKPQRTQVETIKAKYLYMWSY
jgi:phenol 2-monooxygenase